MKTVKSFTDPAVAEAIAFGELVVMPTDTIMGIVASALNPMAIERLYQARHRNLRKRCIILISSCLDLDRFRIDLPEPAKKILQEVWPGPVSIELPMGDKKWDYLNQGLGANSFRLPDRQDVVDLIKEVGPISAPSANLEGEPPCQSINEAQRVFGDKVAVYVDTPVIGSQPSRLIRLHPDGRIERLR